MQALALRLHPHQDLKIELDTFARTHQLEAACVLTCVGSLRKAVLRLADQPGVVEFEQKFEIVSLTGTLSQRDAHYHISLSDSTGRTLGGHLWEGCLIYTTAEIVIGVLPGTRFVREFDPDSGYDELVVQP
jgi:predicted DNA-binding protein with PD1-like motif